MDGFDDGAPFESRTSPTPSQVRGTWPENVTTTDVEDKPITWVVVNPRVLYFVEDQSRIYKPYKDRFFLFPKPEQAIRKAVALGYLNAPKPEELQPGIYFCSEYEYMKIRITAIEVGRP